MIKCGHCKEGHATVAAVRECATATSLVGARVGGGLALGQPRPERAPTQRSHQGILRDAVARSAQGPDTLDTMRTRALEAERNRAHYAEALEAERNRAVAQTDDLNWPTREHYAEEARRDREDNRRAAEAKEAAETSLNAGLARILDLLDTRVVDKREAASLRTWATSAPTVTLHGIRTAIARLESYDVKRSGGPVTRDGIYRTPDGQIWKAQWNRAGGDGRKLYAKRWNAETKEYVYTPGGLQRFKDTDRLTRDQVSELGKDQNGPLYGFCGKCGADLTLDDSISRGMGLTCYGKGEYWA